MSAEYKNDLIMRVDSKSKSAPLFGFSDAIHELPDPSPGCTVTTGNEAEVKAYRNTLARRRFKEFCNANIDADFPACSSNTSEADLSNPELILKVCLWYNITYSCEGGAAVNACPVKTTGGNDTLYRMKRFSQWVEKNHVGLKNLTDDSRVEQVIFSSGKGVKDADTPYNLSPVSSPWQNLALLNNLWPVGIPGTPTNFPIYKVDNSAFSKTQFANDCNPVNTDECNKHYHGKIINKSGHLNHYHIKVK